MECKKCHCPIDQAIEGELICSRCWTIGQQDDESKMVDTQIEEYYREQHIEAERCRKLGICFVCEEPLGKKHICWSIAVQEANQ